MEERSVNEGQGPAFVRRCRIEGLERQQRVRVRGEEVWMREGDELRRWSELTPRREGG